MMAATWIPRSTAGTVIVALLQIQGLLSVAPTAVTGVEGQALSFRCDYPQAYQSSVKYFCRADRSPPEAHLIATNKSKRWETSGRVSLYDNTTEARVIVRMDELAAGDSGAYWCGVDVSPGPDHITVIQLTVVQAAAAAADPQDPQDPLLHDKVSKPLFLTAVTCVAAMLSVCVFTLCLVLTVKQRRWRPRHNRQTSAEYETMMPGVRDEPLISCPCPDCAEVSAFSPPPTDLRSDFASKQRESTVSHGYVDVDAPGHICQYQQLDVNQIEDNVYHSLYGKGVLIDKDPLESRNS